MGDEAHVRLVDPHPECDRGDDHDSVLVDEAILVARARIGVETRVIGQGLDPGLGERGRGILDLGARQAIDDSGVARVTLGDKGLQLRRRILLVDDFIPDIGPIKACDKARCAGQPKPVDDLLAGEFVGRGGQCDARHIRKTL